MGFSAFPPRFELSAILQTIEAWTPRADVALILSSPPWDLLLAGARPDSLIGANEVGLAGYYRAKGLRVIVSVDPTNGLDRSADDPKLVAAGRSLVEPEVQMLLRNYVTAMDTLVRPDYLSFASETNLVRAAAPRELYDALVQVANDAAADVRAVDATVKLYATVQVETAWGRLTPGGTYVGLAQDRADFPFMEALGLSSYPYLGGFAEPESIPIDYYTRLVEDDPLPMLVIEGGWSSVTVALPSSPDHQRRYIARHARLLDEADAVAWFQITYTDIDLAEFPQPPGGAPLSLFAYLGLVDKDFNPKPARAVWDAIFARPRL